MKSLLQLTKNKKGLSNIIAYVLLISITISLSVLVYNWLSFYVTVGEGVEECSDNVNIVIQNYSCVKSSVVGANNGYLEITLRNKGFFTVDGYMLRAHDRVGADLGFYILNNTGEIILPGKTNFNNYSFSTPYGGHNFDNLTFIEVQPFLLDGKKISCKSSTSQKIICT